VTEHPWEVVLRLIGFTWLGFWQWLGLGLVRAANSRDFETLRSKASKGVR
jgi:hypothetical protein